MPRETLSVVLANYNHAHYIGGALEAIIGQSYPATEIIVIDDGSKDNSVEVIESFRARCPAITLLRNEVNKGNTFSNNRGIRHATGDYLFLTAADDGILPGFFEKSMEQFRRHPRAGLCSALVRLIDKDGKDLGVYRTPVISKEPVFVPPEEVLPVFRKFTGWVTTNSVICKRSAVLEVGGYDAQLGPVNDGFLNYLILAKYGACFIPEPLVTWRKMDTGYALSYGADVGKSLALWDLLERRLRSSPNGAPIHDEYLDWWRKAALLSILYELTRKEPYRHDQVLAVLDRLPSRTLTDKAFTAAARARGPVGRLLLKAYLLSQQERGDQLRIVAGKLKRLAAPAARADHG